MTALAPTCKWESYQIESGDNFKNPPIKALNDLSHANKHTHATYTKQSTFHPKTQAQPHTLTHQHSLTHTHTHKQFDTGNKPMMGHNQGIRESRWRRNNPRNYQQNQQQVQSSKRLKCHKINTFHPHTHTHVHRHTHMHTCKLNREAATGRQH